MKRLAQAAAAFAVLAACALILQHLHMPHSTQRAALSAPKAYSHERMERNMPSGPVDINHADAQELTALTGVGPAVAQRIVDERERGGMFHYPEDLLAVRGIGAKKLEKLRHQICLH